MEKVYNFIRQYRLLKKGDTIVAAVSGGPDSLCLLHMLHELKDRFDLRIVVAHLNHYLRPEADSEADEVRRISACWSMPCEVKTVDIRKLKKELGVSEEVAGRKARYDFFYETANKYNANLVALGHHMDDLAETTLMNIIRGTGIDGLSAIMPKRRTGNILVVRPLLCLTRREIEVYCQINMLTPLTDSSNLETEYTRNKLRLQLIPQLEKEYNPRFREALYGLAILARDDRRYLNTQALKAYKKIVCAGPRESILLIKDLFNLAPSIRGRVLRLCLQKIGSSGQITRKHIRLLSGFAKEGNSGKQMTLPGSILVSVAHKNLVIRQVNEEYMKKIERKALKVPGKTVINGDTLIETRIIDRGNMKWPPPKNRAYLDYDTLPPGEIMITNRWNGARFHPQGAGGSKKLKKFLIDQKIPYYKRDFIPLLAINCEIIWVVGIRIAHPYRVTDQTRRILQLDYKVCRLRKS
ncbi:MAG: tRNA lysidine(34) synthetase TilS [Bacillota bacterium]|nr:tRNA lysidine(34) synthetase TilS [Bacillota bacterium]